MGRNSLNHVYKSGKAVRSGELTLRYFKSAKDDYRLAVVVSKKVSKAAVTRNRIRRRVYEHFRVFMKEHNNPLPYDIIITVFDKSVAGISSEELKTKLAKLLKSVGAI